MTIFHFIPTHEESLHDASTECRCDPKPIPGDELDADGTYAGETVYEHLSLTKVDPKDYVVKS